MLQMTLFNLFLAEVDIKIFYIYRLSTFDEIFDDVFEQINARNNSISVIADSRFRSIKNFKYLINFF